MIRHIKKTISSFFALVLSTGQFLAQPSSPDYFACPNQTVLVTITWNNVGNVSYTLVPPPGSNPSAQTSFGGTNINTIVISHQGTLPTPGNPPSTHTYVVWCTGTSATGPVTATINFALTLTQPPPLTLTNTTYYCPGQTATIVAPSGGYYYNIASACYSQNNILFPTITIPNLQPSHNCTYTVTSVGACTVSGVTTITVAPLTPISLPSSTNICQCIQPDYPTDVALTASCTGATNFGWWHPQGFNYNGINPTGQNTLSCPQPTDAGIWTINADYPWGPTGVTCPKTNTMQINVVPISLLTIAASPANTVCQGGKVNFNAGASPNPNGWSWAGPQSFVASTPNPTINPIGPLNAGTYTVYGLFTNNAITCTTSAKTTVSVVAVSAPIITMPAAVCQGGTVQMVATAPGALQYDWNGPNSFAPTGATVGIGTPPGAQLNASGVYYVTAKFGITSTLCAVTSSAQLNVVPINSISVIPPAHVCQPDNGYLQSSAIGANQYTWFGPNGFLAPGPNAIVYNPTPLATGIYTVLALFNGGNLSCPNTNTVSLVVSPRLTFTLVDRQQACYNVPLSVTGPNGATSYTWSSSTGFSSNAKDISFTSVQPKNSGTYTLAVSLGQCVTSASTTIDVLTPVDFTLSPQSRTVCARDTTYFEAGLTGGSQDYAYTWIPSAFMESNVGPKRYAVPESSTNYNVVGYDITCPNFTVSRSFNVYVDQPPTPVLDLKRVEGCAPFEQLYYSHTKGNGITTYDFGGNEKYQGDSINIPLKKEGTYTLTVSTKGKNGCSGKFEVPYPIVVNPKPNSAILTDPEVPTTLDEITFVPSAQNGKIVDYYWMFSGGEPLVNDTSIKRNVPGWDTSNVKNPVRKYEAAGKYPVMLISTTEGGCIDTVVKFMNVQDNFLVFVPNSFTPNGDGINDIFSIKGTGMKIENYSMQLLDRWGNELFFTKDITEGWNGKVNGIEANVDTYIYRIKVVGMNGEGRREYVGHFTLVK